jgi:hypothetical protein
MKKLKKTFIGCEDGYELCICLEKVEGYVETEKGLTVYTNSTFFFLEELADKFKRQFIEWRKDDER